MSCLFFCVLRCAVLPVVLVLGCFVFVCLMVGWFVWLFVCFGLVWSGLDCFVLVCSLVFCDCVVVFFCVVCYVLT